MRLRACLAALAVGLSGAIACAHTAPSFEDDVLRKGDLRVQVGPVPAGWRRIDVASADLAFRDDARSGSARCFESSEKGHVPLSVPFPSIGEWPPGDFFAFRVSGKG